MIRSFSLFLFLFLSLSGLQGQSLWTPLSGVGQLPSQREVHVAPAEGHYYHLQVSRLAEILAAAPQGELTIPGPDGVMRQFRFQYDPVMEPGIQSRYPEIATYRIRSTSVPVVEGRISLTPRGFQAIFRLDGRLALIDPVFRDGGDYCAVYFQDAYWADATEATPFECHAEHADEPDTSLPGMQTVAALRGAVQDLTEYRIAIATTGEYSIYHGGTLSLVLAELANVLNRTNFIFRTDVGVTVKLIDDNDKIIFFNPATDGFTNGNAAAMINENPGIISQFIPLNAYDVGHVFGVFTIGPAIGIAQTPSVCTNSKARGASNGQPPKFDPFVVQVFCHELGHQFSAQHSFNKCDEQNENPPTGWEPGSGSTIMSYNGACGTNNVQGQTDPYFHTGNMAQMRNYTTNGFGATCGMVIPTVNEAPDIEWPYTNGFFIPISTPFELRASATDPNGDALTYSWEQMDTGPITDAGNPIFNSPLFRSFPASTSPLRVFPQLFRILTNNNSKFELLPTYSRDLTFRFTVRDNHPEAGAIATRDVAFKSTAMAGPFRLTKFNTIDTVRQGDFVEVTWDVANTNMAPVNCAHVNILLSTDGGLNFTQELAGGVPNTGSFQVTIPALLTNNGRIRVEAADNIFFDISRANLRILPALEPGFAFDLAPKSQVACIPNVATYALRLDQLLAFDGPVTFSVVSGLPAGATVSFSENPAQAPNNITMMIDLSGATETGTFTLLVRGESASMGTIIVERQVELRVFRGDYSTLDAVNPPSGASSVGQSPLLQWVSQVDAATYRVEMATSPAFGPTTIFSQDGLVNPQFQTPVVLPEGALYFWRVIPGNICGQAEDVPVFAFHTVTLSCAEATNSNSFVIPAQGTQVIESPIVLNTGGTVGTLRVKGIQGSHQNIGQLRGNLRGPDGKSVRLYTPKCPFINGAFLFNINDDSPTPFDCPPDKGNTYKSQEPLSTFNGDPLNGTWTFVLEDLQTGSGGQLSSWTLEFCSDVALNAPYLVTNEELVIKPGGLGFLNASYLLSEDDDNSPAELRYTLVENTRKGTLLKAGVPMQVGDVFSQADVSNWQIGYQHSSQEEEADQFRFTVEDGKGGWFGIETFRIRTDESVSLNQPGALVPTIEIWPNPAQERCMVRVPGQLLDHQRTQVANILGQVVRVPFLPVGDDQLSLDTSGLAAGTYIIRLWVDGRYVAGKVMVQRN